MEVKGFVGPTSVTSVLTFDQQDVINLILENAENEGTTSQASYIRVPGFEQRGTGTIARGRANVEIDGRNFAVIGSQFVEITSGWNLTVLGTVAVDANPATVCWNGDGGGQIFVTSGDKGYIYDLLAATFTVVRTSATTMGDFLDGYFIALDASTGTGFLSDLLDGTVWDPTQFIQEGTASDSWVSMKVSNQYVYFFGTETSHAWYNAGTFPIPFAPHPSGFIQYGIAAPFSPEVVASTLNWLGQTSNGNGFVLSAPGFQPKKISTFAINKALSEFSTITDGVGDAYEENGHSFYLLTLPTADVTFAFDLSTSSWHKRGTWISEDNVYESQRALFHAYAYGQHRWLDRETAAFYQSSLEYGFDVETRPLRWLRRSPTIMDENRFVLYPYFEIVCDVGVGLATGQGSDPKVMLRISNDFGKTWGNEIQKSMGKIGKYGERVRWTRCGMGRKRVWEVSGSDPVMTRITGAYQGAERQEGAA